MKKAAEQLNISGLNDTYYLPTITLDARIGGVIFPFDVGITISKLDTSTLGSYQSAIDPITFDFYTIGADIRYAVLKGGLLPKLSVGGGFYYSKGSVKADNNDASVNMDFDTTTVFLDAQVSKKLLMFIPFAGVRALFSKSSNNWDWKVSGGYATYINDYNTASGTSYKTSDSGSSDRSFGTVQPQIFGGLGIDLFLINITISGCYDIRNNIPSGAASLRLAL